MKQLILLTAFLLPAFYAFSQRYDEQCAAQVYTSDEFSDLPWVGNNDWIPEYLESIGYTGATYNFENARYRVPVFFWIYRGDDEKTEEIDDKRIKKYINNLNYFYTKNNTGIIFYLQGYEKIANGSNDGRMGYFLEGPVKSMQNSADGAVNVHIVNRLSKGTNKPVKGTYNGVTQSVFIQKNASSSTLSHEVGHYFGLLHPHENWDKGKCRAEAVSRTRTFEGCMKSGLICEESGDGLCDTPAEPNLQNYTTQDCKFYGKHLRDPWGDKYKPVTNNIMSYTKKRDCRNHFTKGQIAVMLNTAAKDKHAASWMESTKNQKHRFDASEPDNSRDMATEIKLNAPYHFTFHTIYKGENAEKQDLTDWVRFTLKSAQTVKVLTSKADHTFPDMTLQLFNANNKKIKESNKEAKHPALKMHLRKGTYWLKISRKKASSFLRDYQLEIQV